MKTTASLSLDAGTSKNDAATDAKTGGYTGWDALPAATVKAADVKFLDLGSDAVAAIAGNTTAETYLAFLDDQTHMKAVQALHYMTGYAIKPIARSVGVQSWQWKTSEAGFQYIDYASVVEGKHSFIEALNEDAAKRALPAGLANVSLLDKSAWAEVLSGITANSSAVSKIETDLLGANWGTATPTVVGNDELVRDLAWRFATDSGLTALKASANTVLYSGGDLSLTSGGDIGIKGGTVIAAANNVRLDAGQDIVLLGVNGAGIVANQANAAVYGSTAFHDPTGLARASVSAGNDLTLVAKRDIWNVGSSISSVGDLTATAGGDIQNQAIGTYFTQTAETGCLNLKFQRSGVSRKVYFSCAPMGSTPIIIVGETKLYPCNATR